MISVRGALEATAADLAAERRTEVDLHRTETLLEQRERAWASGDGEAFVTADTAFHLSVAAASHTSGRHQDS